MQRATILFAIQTNMYLDSAISCIFTLALIMPCTTAVETPATLWTNGVVPYWISRYYEQYEREVILAAMEEFHRFTCVRLVPRTDQYDFIIIKPKQGCSSHIGRRGGAQYLSLVHSCITKKTIVQEIMHTLGFVQPLGRAKRWTLTSYAIPNSLTFIVRHGLSFPDEMAINKMYDCPQQHPDESIDNPNWSLPSFTELG